MDKVKTIFKELAIVILLFIAVILIVTILFYDYIPNDKTVPIKIQAYSIPSDIQEELDNSIPEGQNIVRTYYIDSTDLDSYESTNEYDKGKANPFVDYSQKETDNSTNETNSGNQNNTNNTNTSNNNTQNQEETNKNEVYKNTPGKNY